MSSLYLKTNRVFNPIRKYSWILTLLVGLGGLWEPKLGLLVIPIMLTLMIMAFFKGRYWCGNFCSHGSFFDVILMPISKNKKIPAFLTSRVTAWLFFAFFGYNLVRRFIAVSALWVTTPFWDRLGFIFVMSYIMVIVVGGSLAIFVSPRTWCHFCPMGTIQVLSYKLGKLLGVNKGTDEKVTIANPSMCHTCAKCSRVCPLQLEPYLEFSDKNQFNHEACIRCSTCVGNCPAGILSLGSEEQALKISAQTSDKGYEHRRKISSTVKQVQVLSPDVREYTFTLEDTKSIHFEPGQFILVKIADKPIMYRAYSISGFDKSQGELKIAIKAIPGGGYGTNIIFNDFIVGANVELEGPIGHELIVNKSSEKILLVAGGIGITPFLPIVQDLIVNAPEVKEITLVHGVNKADEFIYEDEFKALADSPKFNYVQVVAFDDEWQGKKGFVTDAMKEMSLLEHTVYMCGPKPMTNAAQTMLINAGVETESIFLESA